MITVYAFPDPYGIEILDSGEPVRNVFDVIERDGRLYLMVADDPRLRERGPSPSMVVPNPQVKTDIDGVDGTWYRADEYEIIGEPLLPDGNTYNEWRDHYRHREERERAKRGGAN